MGKFDYICLLNSNMYDRYNKDFPENSLKILDMNYGTFLYHSFGERIIYSLYSQEFKNKPAFELVKFMNENGLQVGLKEVYNKLVKMTVTILTTTSTAGRIFLHYRG